MKLVQWGLFPIALLRRLVHLVDDVVVMDTTWQNAIHLLTIPSARVTLASSETASSVQPVHLENTRSQIILAWHAILGITSRFLHKLRVFHVRLGATVRTRKASSVKSVQNVLPPTSSQFATAHPLQMMVNAHVTLGILAIVQ